MRSDDIVVPLENREPVLLFLFRRCLQPDPKDEDLTLEQRDQREVEGTPPAPGVSFLSVDHWLTRRYSRGGDCLDGGRSDTADPTGQVQLTLSLSGSKEELTALYGELRKPRSELQRAGVSILLEQHGTEVEDAFNEVGEVFNQFEAEYYVVQQNLRDDWLGQLTEVKAQRAALLQAAHDRRQAMLRTLVVLEQPIPEIALPPWWRLW